MVSFFYAVIQCSWGGAQTLLGLVFFLCNGRAKHEVYHGAVVTHWKYPSGLSLGLFVFLPEEKKESLLPHEYGHTLQSLTLGPLYLPVIGLPSVIWARAKYFQRRRQEKNISYYSFYTERWADAWGKSICSQTKP